MLSIYCDLKLPSTRQPAAAPPIFIGKPINPFGTCHLLVGKRRIEKVASPTAVNANHRPESKRLRPGQVENLADPNSLWVRSPPEWHHNDCREPAPLGPTPTGRSGHLLTHARQGPPSAANRGSESEMNRSGMSILEGAVAIHGNIDRYLVPSPVLPVADMQAKRGLSVTIRRPYSGSRDPPVRAMGLRQHGAGSAVGAGWTSIRRRII